MALEAAKGKVALRKKKKKDAILIFIARDQHLPHKVKQCFHFFQKKCWLFSNGKCLVAITFFRFYLQLAIVWRIPPVSYTPPCFMNTKEEEEDPPHIHFETSLRSLSSRKRKRKGIVFVSSFVKKKQGTNCHFPPFPCKKCWWKFFLFFGGVSISPEKGGRGCFYCVSLSLSLSSPPPFPLLFSGRWVSSFFLSVSFFVFPQSHGLMCLVCETRKGGEGSA